MDAWDNDTSPVGNYAANGYGLYDMAGNVAEWVNDFFNATYYSTSPTNDPQGPAGPLEYRVIRGGGWIDNTNYMRVAPRLAVSPLDVYNHVGFRCARD